MFHTSTSRREFVAACASLAATACARPARGAGHRFISQDKKQVAIFSADNEVEWLWENGTGAHDIHVLPSGNVLAPVGRAAVVEITPDEEVVWEHESKSVGPYDGPVEIHGFERYANGNTMVAETGNKRIIELDAAGDVVAEIPLQVDNPHPHHDTRLVRKTAAGTYLVPHEFDGVVREYDAAGEVIWSYEIELTGPETPTHQGHGRDVYSAYRLPDGNTLIGAGKNNRVLEVNPAGEIVWEIGKHELPGIELFWVTQLERLPNGNTVIANTHAGETNPQLIEVTCEKEVVWTFFDWETLGNSVCVHQMLDIDGPVIR